MRESKPHTKRVRKHLPLHRRGTCNEQTDLLGEKDILELISRGAPLAGILNNLCTAIDLQLGNIVSVMLLPDDSGRDFKTIAHGALQFGLHLYWSADIALWDESVLGSFEMYCCVPRTPTASELELIRRATHLAAIAIRRHYGDEDLSGARGEWKRILEKRLYEAAHIN
jgi:hypothetical protein